MIGTLGLKVKPNRVLLNLNWIKEVLLIDTNVFLNQI